MNIFEGLQLILLLSQTTYGQFAPKILDGVVPEPGEFPFMVTIREFVWHHSGRHFSGIILNEGWILTVGSSMLNHKLTGAKIIGGEHNISVTEGNEQLRHLAAVVPHPNRTIEPSRFVRNDLLLAKVQPPFVFNDYVQPALLPTRKQMIVQQNHTIAGWGRTSTFTETDTLHKAHLQKIDDDTCAFFYPDAFDENVVCSGNREADVIKLGSCSYDAGGPLICFDDDDSQYLCGIISQEDWRPCEEDKPTLSIKLHPYMDWIWDTIDNYNATVEYSWAESINTCGGILPSSAGRISYQVGEHYKPNERCVWKIQLNPNHGIAYRIEHYGIQNDAWVGLAGLHNGQLYSFWKLDPNDVSVTNGEVYFIAFYSNGNNFGNGTGFSFIFESGLAHQNSLHVHSHARISEDSVTNYPKEGYYENNELFTLVLNAGEFVAWINLTRIDILGGSESCEEDVLRLYEMKHDGMVFRLDSWCGQFDLAQEYNSDAGVIIAVFSSNDQIQGTGFSLEFEKQIQLTTIATTLSTTTENMITTIMPPTISTTSLATVPTTSGTTYTTVVPTTGRTTVNIVTSTTSEGITPVSTKKTGVSTETSAGIQIAQNKNIFTLICFIIFNYVHSDSLIVI